MQGHGLLFAPLRDYGLHLASQCVNLNPLFSVGLSDSNLPQLLHSVPAHVARSRSQKPMPLLSTQKV